MQTHIKPLNNITVELELTEDFIKACEFCNIDEKAALETYLSHITFYNFLFDEGEEFNALATKLFKKNNRDHFTSENVQTANHSELHLAPIKEILAVGKENLGSSSVEYKNIIKKWYKSIPKK